MTGLANQGPADRVARLERHNPHAAQLARLLSLAVRIEPMLVRRARLLVPGADASAEADLWFSELVTAQNPRGIVLERDVAEELRDQLAGDPERLDSAWDLIETFHREAPWSIRVEEKINRLSLSPAPADQARIEDLLLAAAREMAQAGHDKGPARWMIRALERLPRAVRGSESSRMLALGAGARLDGRLDLGDEKLPADAVESWFAWLFPQMEPVEIGVRLLDGAVEAGALDGDGVSHLPIPPTRPLLLDVRWHDGQAQQRERLEIPRGESRRLRVGAHTVELGTILGERYRLAASGAPDAAGGFDFSGVRAAHRPFYGREQELAEIWRAAVTTDEPNGRFIAIHGAAGLGKTALLGRFLDRLEQARLPVIHHFLRAEPATWGDRQAMEASLLIQLRAHFPEPGIQDAKSLEDAFETFLDSYDKPPRPRLHIAVDGDASVGEDPLQTIQRSLPADGPYQISVLWAARDEPVLDERLESGTLITSIDLGERKSSNLEVCEHYLFAHQEEILELTESESRSTEPLDLLMNRADGNIGRLRNMHRWLREQQLLPVDLESMPPTLYGATARVWGELASTYPERDLERLVGALAAAREPLPQLLLFPPFVPMAQVERPHVAVHESPEPQSRILWRLARGTTVSAAEESDDWTRIQVDAGEGWVRAELLSRPVPVWGNDPPEHTARLLERLETAAFVAAFPGEESLERYGLAHPSVSAWIENRLGVESMMESHRLLADLFPDDGWARDDAPRGFRRNYSRRHQAYHLIQLQEWRRLHGLLTHLDYLTETCTAEGAGALEAVLATVCDAFPDGELADDLGWILRALRADATRLHERPGDLPTLLHGRLRAGGEQERLAAEALRSATGRPYFWLRHVLQRTESARDFQPAGESLKTLAFHRGVLYAGARSGTVFAWRFGTDKPVRTLVNRPGPVTVLLAAREGPLLTGTGDGKIRLWVDGELEHEIEGPGGAILAARWVAPLAGERDTFAACSASGTVLVWRDGKSQHLVGHAGEVTCCDELFDGNDRLLTGSADCTLRLWGLADGKTTRHLIGHAAPVTTCTMSSRRVLSGDDAGVLKFWDIKTGESRATFSGHRAAVTGGLLFTQKRRAVSSSLDGTIRLWDLRSRRETHRLGGHRGEVLGLVSVSKEQFASFGRDGTVRLWTLDQGREVARFETRGGAVRAVEVVNEQLVAATEGGTIEVFPVESTAATADSEPRPSCAIGPGGDRVLIASRDPAPAFWDARDAEPLGALQILDMPLTFCAMNRGGDFYVTVDDEGVLRYWSLDGEETATVQAVVADFIGKGVRLTALAVTYAGLVVFTGRSDGHISSWWRRSGEPTTPGRLAGHIAPVRALASDRDGRLLLSAADDGTLRLWTIETGEPLSVFNSHRGPVTACDLSRDGRRALSGGADGTLKLWDVDTGRVARELHGHRGEVTACTFSLSDSDQGQAYSASVDGTLKLWDLETGDCVETFHGRSGFTDLDLATSPQTPALAAVDATGRGWVLDLRSPPGLQPPSRTKGAQA